MKKKWIIGLSILAGIVAFWLVLKEVKTGDIITLFKETSPLLLLIYIAVSAGIMIALSYRWKVILKSQSQDVPLRKLFAYRIVGYGISYITPSAKMGGEPVRAGLLSKEGIPFSKGLSSVVIDKTIEIAFHALFLFIEIIIVLFTFALPENTEIMLVLFSIVFLGLMSFIYHRLSSGKGFIKSLCKKLKIHKIKSLKVSEKKIEEFEKSVIFFFKHNRKTFYQTLIFSFIAWVLMFIEFKTAGLILGFDFSFAQIVLITAFMGAAFLIPIPMALGSIEVSQVSAFILIGFGNAGGIAIALLVRIRDLVWTIISFFILGYFGIKADSFIKKEYE